MPRYASTADAPTAPRENGSTRSPMAMTSADSLPMSVAATEGTWVRKVAG